MRVIFAVITAGVLLSACEPPVRAPAPGETSAPVTKSREELAKEAFEISGQRAFFEETLRAGFVEFQRSPRLQSVFNEELKVSVDQLSQEAMKIYESEFSAQELADMIAFFNTPSGQAYLAKQAVFGERLEPVARTVSVELGRRIATRVQREGLLSGVPG